MKEQTERFIKEVLNAVPIEINYKHDKFLECTTSGKKYISSNLKAPNYKEVGKGNLDKEYKAKLREKRELPVNVIKSEIIINYSEDGDKNKGNEKLAKLEEEYIHNCKKYALAADENFDDKYKDEIIDNLVTFIDDVTYTKFWARPVKSNYRRKKHYSSAERFLGFEYFGKDDIDAKCEEEAPKKLAERFLTRVDNDTRKSMKLVYVDGKGGEYQFETLDALLESVARYSVEYSKKAMEKRNKAEGFDNKPIEKKKDKRGETIPMFIRQVCAMICYTLLDFGNVLSLNVYRMELGRNSGVSSQIMADLHRRCKEDFKHNYFQNEKKLFQYNKWSISPEYMLRMRSYIPPKLPMTYLGVKEGYLGYMISELQSQVVYTTFLDAFGGSGASSVQFKHRKDAQYYINDFNFCIVSYYRVMQGGTAVFNEFIDKLHYLWNLYGKAFDLAVNYLQELVSEGISQKDANKLAGKEFYEFSDVFFDLFESMSNFSWNEDSGKVLETPLKNRTDLINGVCSVEGKDYKFPEWLCKYAEKEISYIDAAVLFAFYAMHTLTCGIERHIFSDYIFDSDRYITKEKLKQKFLSFRNELDSIIVNEIGASAMDLLGDDKYNNKDTLVYLDSPYIGTVGYSVKNKSSEKGKKVPTITQKNVGSDFYFEDFDMKDLLYRCKYFKGKYIFSCRENMVKSDVVGMSNKKKLASSAKRIRLLLNNYIWFWKSWEQSSDSVLFMYDLSYNSSNCYEDLFSSEELDVWGEGFSIDVKKNICQYLYDCAFHGSDLEVMITNFKHKTPEFENMYEYIINVYQKKTDVIKKIPKDGVFVEMPVKNMAKIILSAMQVYIDKL